ncbi:MAG TPA: TIGR03086 family metal-binding protein [Streptosporangiaceae bacterium]|nr:TIGR03086 family metal-binding protein [Streptosporangiaceae bacterium]
MLINNDGVPDVVRLDAAAVKVSAELVSRITDADLARPTPCAGWTLADLLAHMTSQHRGFAAAAAGDGSDPRHWADKPAAPADYVSAAAKVQEAFAGAGVLDQEFCVLPISATMTFPARQAIGFHLVDYVTHGWDVARSLGQPYELPQDVLDVALRVAIAVPDGEARRAPDASFAPRVPGYDGAATLDRIVALLGRRPSWPALPWRHAG